MNSIKIINSKNQEFDYYDVEELGITFNRIVDDYTQIDTRFSEFSYQFRLPKTSNNNIIFNHSNADNVINKFTRNKQDVEVYINGVLGFQGIIELNEIDNEHYYCTLLSRIAQLTDELGDKELVELQFDDPNWNYEFTIRAHINANYKNCDETLYQFPFVYYSTFQTPSSIYVNMTDGWGKDFNTENTKQNFFYYLNKTSNADNLLYHHQFPIAMYLKPVLEKIFEEAGWGMSGTIFDTDEFKRIIIPYTGDNDVYDNSIYCDDGSDVQVDGTCSTGTLKVKLSNFLPDMTQVDLINNIINTFNLYFDIDVQNKIIRFETYDTWFTNKNNPVLLDGMIDEVNYLKPDNTNPSIKFAEQDNSMINGDNSYYNQPDYYPTINNETKLNTNVISKIYNKEGSDDAIEVDWGYPTIKRTLLWNDVDYNGGDAGARDQTIIFQPMLTKQTKYDNNNLPYNKEDSETNIDNTEDRIKHDGKPCLMYYYGESKNDEVFIYTIQVKKDWFYVNIGSTTSSSYIPFASPFPIADLKVNDYNKLEEKVYASFIADNYYIHGDSGYNNSYSLVFNDFDEVYPTLYTKFHSTKYRRYKQGYIIEARIRMDVYDYNRFKMYKPFKYEQQLYSLLSIEEFDPVNNIGTIKLIKQ